MTASVGTRWNVLPTELSDFVVGGIVGSPTGYNVYNNGALVASASSWPSLTTITKSEDQTVAHAMGYLSPTAASLTPASLNTGDVIVVALAAGQNVITNYTGHPYVSGGGTSAHPIVWSSPSVSYATVWYGVYTGPNVTTGITPISMYAPSSTSPTENNYWTMSRWAGVASVGTLDQYASGAASGGSEWGQSITPSGPGEVVIEVLSGQTTGYAFTSGSSSFTDFPSATSSYGSSGGFAVGYQVQTTSTPLTAASNGWSATATGYALALAAAITLVPASGGTTISIPAPGGGTWAPGSYFIDFVTGTYGSNGYSVDSVQVTVMRNLGKLPSPLALPSPSADSAIGTPNAEGEDLYLHGWLAHGPERYSITNTADPTVDAPLVAGLGRTIAGIQTGLTAEKGANLYFSTGQADAARPRYAMVNFPADYPPTRYDSISGLASASLNFNDTSLTSGDVGELFTGANVPAGTTIATVIPGASGTLSADASGTASGLYGVGGTCTLSVYQAGITEVVNAVGPGTSYGVQFFEGVNEPNGLGIGDSGIATLYNYGRNAARAASSSAIWLGPALVCSAPNGSGFSPTIADVQTIITDIDSGGGALDGVSTHDYNMFGGDFLVTDAAIGGMRSMLATNGIGTIPFWVTELGNIIKNFWNGSAFTYITDRRLITWTAQTYLTCERHGVPKECIPYFYDSYQGGQTIYTCLKSTDDSLGPQATFFRVYSEELWGKAWSASLSFGSVGDNLYRADVFTGTAGKLLTLYAQGMVSDTVTIAGVGSAAITYSDWQGNVTSVTPTSGSVTLTIGDMPIYVRLPTSASPSVSSVGGGLGTAANLALTATAKAGSNPSSLTAQPKINDGTFQTGGYLNGPDYMYQATTIPQYVELDWATAQNVNSVVVRQAPPYVDWPSTAPACAMLTGKLEYWDSTASAWTACPTTAGNHWDGAGNYSNTTANDFLTTIGHDNSAAAGMVYSQWDQNWVLNIPFSASILTTKLRLTALTVSRGNFVNSAVNSWSAIFPAFNISEMMAFNLSGTPAPLVGTGTSALSLVETGAGVAVVAGSGNTTISLSSAGAGVAVGSGAVGSATVTLTGTGVGQSVTFGSGSGAAAVGIGTASTGVAVLSGTGTASPVLAGSGVGIAKLAGTGAQSITISSSSATTGLAVGTSATAITINATGSGVAIVNGTSTCPITVASTATGTAHPSMVGTATVALGGVATGIAVLGGTGTGAVTIRESGSGIPIYLGSGAGAIVAASTSTGVAMVPGSGSAQVSVTDVAQGVALLSGAGAAAVAVGTSAATVAKQSGTSTTAISLSSTGVGVSNFTGSASVHLAGTATGVAILTGTGTEPIAIQGTGTGISILRGVSTTPIAVSGSSVGTGIRFGTSLGTITLTTSGTGAVNYNGTASITLTATGVGVSVVSETGSVQVAAGETLALSLTPLDKFDNPETTDPIVSASVTTDPAMLTYTQDGLDFVFTPTGVIGTTTVTVLAYGRSGASVTKTNTVTVVP